MSRQLPSYGVLTAMQEVEDGILGGAALGSTPEQFGAYIQGEIERWAKVVKAAGVPAE